MILNGQKPFYSEANIQLNEMENPFNFAQCLLIESNMFLKWLCKILISLLISFSIPYTHGSSKNWFLSENKQLRMAPGAHEIIYSSSIDQ